MEIKQTFITKHNDINEVLASLSKNLEATLGNQLIGIYLIGSLTYGDFDQSSSDIDLIMLLSSELSKEQIDLVKNIHHIIASQYPIWAKRIECSYITQDMLSSMEPPARPYINEGQMYETAKFGNEWLINLQVLYQCGIALLGPEPQKLIKLPITIAAVRKASQQDFYQEWEPLLKNPAILKDSHYQAYVILTLCRILYRQKHEDIVSKKVASAWVKENYGTQWGDLIEKAESWQYGQEMNSINEILEFIQFITNELKN